MCNGWYRTVLRKAAARNTLRPPRCPGPNLCGLLPLAVDADQTADSSGDTDDAIVKVDPGERRKRNGQVAEVRDELCLAGSALPVKLLAPIDPGPGSSCTHIVILLLSTTPSPSFLSTLASLSFSFQRV